jgi:hypothetical protein
MRDRALRAAVTGLPRAGLAERIRSSHQVCAANGFRRADRRAFREDVASPRGKGSL